MNKQYDILPTSPVDVFVNLSTQGNDLFITQDGFFLGFDGIDFIDSKQYTPTLNEDFNVVTQSFVNYTPTQNEKIIAQVQYSYLLTSNSDFLRTQDGNFIIL